MRPSLALSVSAIATFVLLARYAPEAKAEGGTGVGNGGDSIHCHADPSHRLEGFYNLDYVLTFDYESGNSDLVAGSWKEQQARIQAVLEDKVYYLGQSLRRFNELAFSKSMTEEIVWKPSLFGLVDVADEEILQRLPPGCGVMPGAPTQTQPVLVQTVIREANPGMVVFNYDPNAIKMLDQLPHQLSFQLTHEWLWSFAPNARAIRTVNRMLHTAEIDRMDSMTLQRVLVNAGINLVPGVPDAQNAVVRMIDVSESPEGKPVLSVDRIDFPRRGLSDKKYYLLVRNRTKYDFIWPDGGNTRRYLDNKTYFMDYESKDPSFVITLRENSTYGKDLRLVLPVRYY